MKITNKAAGARSFEVHSDLKDHDGHWLARRVSLDPGQSVECNGVPSNPVFDAWIEAKEIEVEGEALKSDRKTSDDADFHAKVQAEVKRLMAEKEAAAASAPTAPPVPKPAVQAPPQVAPTAPKS